MKNRPADLPLIYLWMRLQLSDSEAKKYRRKLAEIMGINSAQSYGLDSALREAAEHIARMEDI